MNEGVRQGYVEGYLRLSVVSDPLRRVNTDDNTPAIIHTTIVPGDKLHIVVAPKGFGSENMSAIKMFTPAASREDVIDFIVETMSKAGSNPCPPMIVGVGLGGTFEQSGMPGAKKRSAPRWMPRLRMTFTRRWNGRSPKRPTNWASAPRAGAAR